MLGRLEIAMHDAFLVRGVERIGHLFRDCQRLCSRQRPLASRSASVSPCTISITNARAGPWLDVEERTPPIRE